MPRPTFIDNIDGNSLAAELRRQLAKPSAPASSSPASSSPASCEKELMIATCYFNAAGWFRISAHIEKINKIRLLIGGERAQYSQGYTQGYTQGDTQRYTQGYTQGYTQEWLGEQKAGKTKYLQEQLAKVIGVHEEFLRTEYAKSEFSQTQNKRWQEFRNILARKAPALATLEVRRYTKEFFHAKAWILQEKNKQEAENILSLVAGSSNFTAAGLITNRESNFALDDRTLIAESKVWFEKVWADAEPYDLKTIYENMMRDFSPFEIYLRTLFELYQHEMSAVIEGSEENDSIIRELTDFQKHGAARARRILDTYHGVLIADSVGLGKTFLAGSLMLKYINNRQGVLLVAPAAILDTWKAFLKQQEIRTVDKISYEIFAKAVEDKKHKQLDRNLDSYSLIVVDEAHNYRNRDAKRRAGALQEFMQTSRQQPRDIILLTATPVNNSLSDLQTLLGYFLQDRDLAEHGIHSLEKIFKEHKKAQAAAQKNQNSKQEAEQLAKQEVEQLAEQSDGQGDAKGNAKGDANGDGQGNAEGSANLVANLNTSKIRQILDKVTVKRNRKFIRQYYENSVMTINGEKQKITFPTPKPITVRYNLDEVMPGLFDDVAKILTSEDKERKLTMAQYQLERYLKEPPEDSENEKSIIGLLRSGLLKRFESSAHAFTRTCQRMIDANERILDALARGRVWEKASLNDDEDDDNTDAKNEREVSADKYSVARLKRDLQKDVASLNKLLNQAKSVQPHEDPKLKQLVAELEKIAEQAKNEQAKKEQAKEKKASEGQAKEGQASDRQLYDNSKVLVFSYYKDTAKWILKALQTELAKNKKLHIYKDRIAVASGSPSSDEDSLSSGKAAERFAPHTADPNYKESGKSREDIDKVELNLLITTDVLAEGTNLQQCRHIINYDLPWNPMRLVQRHGRIDRLASLHSTVFLRTFFPDKELDELLKLEVKVRLKLNIAAKTAGVAETPIEHGASDQQYFSDNLEEYQ